MGLKICPLTKHSAASSMSPSWNLCWFCEETVYMDTYQYLKHNSLRLTSNPLRRVELTASVLTVGLCMQLQHFCNMGLPHCPTSTPPLNTWMSWLTRVLTLSSLFSHTQHVCLIVFTKQIISQDSVQMTAGKGTTQLIEVYPDQNNNVIAQV